MQPGPMLGVPAGNFDVPRVMQAWQDLQQTLVPLWQRVDAEYARDTVLFSARRFDESRPGGERTYMQASSLLSVALDNLGALRALITTHGATIWVPWSLLRGVFESSAWVLWMLEPDDGLTRRRRGIRRAVLDQREWRNFAVEYARTRIDREDQTALDTKITNVYRGEAQSCGMAWTQATQKLNLVDELPKLPATRKAVQGNDPPVDPRVVAGLCRSLSGMARGYAYAAQSNSNTVGSVEIPGGKRMTYTIKDTSFEVHALLSTSLLIEALGIYMRRSQYPA